MELATTVPNPSSLSYDHEDAEMIASHHHSSLMCFNLLASRSRPNELNGKVQRQQLSLSTLITLHQCCQTSADSYWWSLTCKAQVVRLWVGGWRRQDNARWCFMYTSHHRGKEVFVEMRFSSSGLLLWSWLMVQLCAHQQVKDNSAWQSRSRHCQKSQTGWEVHWELLTDLMLNTRSPTWIQYHYLRLLCSWD